MVMFPSARMHVCRVARVLRQRRGHAMLIGVGGSGRRSTARLAAFVNEMDLVEVLPGSDWKADLRETLVKAGTGTRRVTLVVRDESISTEEALEDINTLLNGGAVPNLFNADDTATIVAEVGAAARAAGAATTADVMAFFYAGVHRSLSIVLCLSPMAPRFRCVCGAGKAARTSAVLFSPCTPRVFA